MIEGVELSLKPKTELNSDDEFNLSSWVVVTSSQAVGAW